MRTTTIVISLILFALPSISRAQYGASVLPFEGRQGAQLRRSVTRAIRDQVDLRTQRQLRQAVTSSRGDLSTASGLSAVARELGVSLFVRGETSGRRRSARLRLSVLGADGEELANTEVGPLRGRSGMRKVNQAAQSVVQNAIDQLDAQTTSERNAETAAHRAELERIQGPDDQDGLGEFDLEEEEDSSGSLALPLFEIVVGAAGRYRDLQVELETPGSTRTYSAFYTELYARLRSHPLRDEGGMLAGLYGEAEFSLAVGLESEDDETGQQIPTSAMHLEGGLGWLFGPLGPVRLGPYVGFGYDSFALDPNTILPTANYMYLRPTFVLLADLLDPYLQLRVDAGLRVVLSASDLDPFFGESSSALGFDAAVELGGALPMGFAYGVRGGIQSYGLSFDGAAAVTADNAVDGTDLRLVLMGFVGYRL